MVIFLFNFFPKQAGVISTFPFCNGLELPAQVYPLQLFTSLRSLKWFHSLFSFLALFLSPIACRNSAALSDFVSGLPFSSTNSSFCNRLDFPAHLLGRRSPVFDLADYMFVLYPFWSLISIRHASGFLNSCMINLYRLWEQRFVRTFDLQKGVSLSEAVNDGSGKEMVWVPKI